MHRPYLATCLSLYSLTVFAFDPSGSGWHGSSELAPTITFAKYLGTGKTRTVLSSYIGNNAREGAFSLAGLEMQQSVGWHEWFTLDLSGSFSQSSVATSSKSIGYNRFQAQPASLSLWDMGAEAFTSLALDSKREVWLEPAVGYSLVGANMKNAVTDGLKREWEKLKFHGPTFGLYLRLFLSPKVSLRMGGGYMASRLRVKKYAEGLVYFTYPYAAGDFMASYQLHNRRHGLFGLARLDYLWKSWVRFYSAVDFRSYSAGGGAEAGDFRGDSSSTQVPAFSRVRFSWGVNFAY